MKKVTCKLILVIVMAAISCSRPSMYPGFKDTEDGIHYRLHKIGENALKARPGDYVTVNLEYETLHDSSFFRGTRKLQVDSPAFKGAIDACFAMLAEGDSATFILSGNDFFTKTLKTSRPRFIPADGAVKINVGMVNIQTRDEYEKEKEAFLSWIEDFGDYEKVILRQFISAEKPGIKPLPSGIYYVNLRPGTGKKVEIGDTITINYEGRFLNGKFFDSTVRRNQPFQFVYGTEWQVIKGLEEAIGMMREGERALFILPSELGFGNQGSSTGIIPPFTSLIFEVEILKVSSPGKI
jgi:FKBP-type peptidyl-prolyl cis-trans isomerase FkpA